MDAGMERVEEDPEPGSARRPSDPPPAQAARDPWIGWLAALVLVCAAVGAATVSMARDRDCLANPDEAAYAEQADAILRGGPLQVGFVRYFHRAYPSDVVHPEDFYPPGQGALLALAWRCFGRSDFANAIPSIAIACFLLPLVTFLLARKLGAGGAFSFSAAVACMLAEIVRAHALQGLADLPLTVLVAFSTWIALRGGALAGAVSGALLGGAFYFKPAALLFLPGSAGIAALAGHGGLSARSGRAGLLLLAFALVALPWMWRNQREFGDPLYSGNKHLTALANDPSWRYADIRKVYFADPEFELPSMAESPARFGIRPVVTRFLSHLWECAFEDGRFVFTPLFVIAALLLTGSRAALLVIGHALLYAVALSAVFAIEPRYLLPLLPLGLAVSFSGLGRIASALDARRAVSGSILDPAARALSRIPGLCRIAPASAAALLVLAAMTLGDASAFARDFARGVRTFAPRGDECIRDSALWAREHLPAGSRVMAQEALRFRYYSGLLTVNIPFDAPERIQTVVDHYRIDAIVLCDTGNYAEMSVRFLGAYLTRHAADWKPERPAGASFTVYRRKNVP